MGDKSVATGVLNFAHASIGIIIFLLFLLLCAPVMNESVSQSCE